MINFCTLFDSNYILFGLNLYKSLEENCKAFHLYIFAFDAKSYEVLTAINLPHATIISLSDFEDEKLLQVKPTRSRAEYCWTCTPSTILYCLNTYNLSNCTYIDADLFFYKDPKVLIDEMGEKSVLITSHRYTPAYDQSKVNGIYCVQFLMVKNNPEGLKVANWWREACIDWCYDRVEDGKFGDQKYLDNWPKQFAGIHELENLGGGVAPWNVQQYKITNTAKGLTGLEYKTGNKFDLIFFHFHGLRLLQGDKVDLCGYKLSASVKEIIYQPYLRKLVETKNWLKEKDYGLNLDSNFKRNKTLKHYYTNFKKMLNQELHIQSLIQKP